MYTSEWLAAQPTTHQFDVLSSTDQRSAFALEPLLVSTDRQFVLRPITDLDKIPVTDYDTFQTRVNLLRDVCSIVPSATFSPYLGQAGGVIVTEFINGETFNVRAQRLRDEMSATDLEEVVDSFNDTAPKLTEYYQMAIEKRAPMVVDLFKSNQWVVGASSSDPVVRPRITDHDCHVVLGHASDYDEHERLVMADLVIVQAAALAIFLSNVGKAPEIQQPKLFGPAIEALVSLIQTASKAGIDPETLGRPSRAIHRIVSDMMLSSRLSNEPMFDIRKVHQKIITARLKYEKK